MNLSKKIGVLVLIIILFILSVSIVHSIVPSVQPPEQDVSPQPISEINPQQIMPDVSPRQDNSVDVSNPTQQQSIDSVSIPCDNSCGCVSRTACMGYGIISRDIYRDRVSYGCRADFTSVSCPEGYSCQDNVDGVGFCVGTPTATSASPPSQGVVPIESQVYPVVSALQLASLLFAPLTLVEPVVNYIIGSTTPLIQTTTQVTTQQPTTVYTPAYTPTSQINMQVKPVSECPLNNIILKLSNAEGGSTNAHGEWYVSSGGGNYQNAICYNGYADSTSHQCLGDDRNAILFLSGYSNAHAVTVDRYLDSPETYPLELCYNQDFQCYSKQNNEACNSGDLCIVKLSDTTNAHLSDCSDTNYPVSVCCKDYSSYRAEVEPQAPDLQGMRNVERCNKVLASGETLENTQGCWSNNDCHTFEYCDDSFNCVDATCSVDVDCIRKDMDPGTNCFEGFCKKICSNQIDCPLGEQCKDQYCQRITQSDIDECMAAQGGQQPSVTKSPDGVACTSDNQCDSNNCQASVCRAPSLILWQKYEGNLMNDPTASIYGGYLQGSAYLSRPDNLVYKNLGGDVLSLYLSPTEGKAVQLPSAFSLQNRKQYTIMAYVYLDTSLGTAQDFYPIISEYNANVAGSYFLAIKPDQIVFHPNDNSYNLVASGNFDKKWIHVAVTVDKAAKKMILYINGDKKDEESYAPPVVVGTKLLVGAYEYSENGQVVPNKIPYFRGAIDNLKLFDKVVPQNRLLELMSCNYQPYYDDSMCGENGICNANSLCGSACSSDVGCGLDSSGNPLVCDRLRSKWCTTKCTSDAECGTGKVCDSTGHCGMGCTSDASCASIPGNYICGSVGGWCIAGCNSDSECTGGKTCQAIPGSSTQKRCLAPVAIPCTSGDDCPSGQECRSGTCVSLPPTPQDPCQPPCRAPDVCNAAMQCDTRCTSDDECNENKVCYSNVCTQRCDDENNCEEDLVCSDSACVVENCKDVRCAPGSICDSSDGRCALDSPSPCSGSNDCDDGAFCNNEKKCEGCNQNLDTDKDGTNDCEDKCPLDPSKKTKPCGSSYLGLSCSQIGGVLCTGGECKFSTISTKTLQYPCCEPLPQTPRGTMLCSKIDFNANLGFVTKSEKGPCEDLDGDGIGSMAVSITKENGALLSPDEWDRLGFTGDPVSGYTEECQVLPTNNKGQAIPFYALSSVLLTIILLTIYYISNNRKKRKL